jgi:hypothetical protein
VQQLGLRQHRTLGCFDTFQEFVVRHPTSKYPPPTPAKSFRTRLTRNRKAWDHAAPARASP